MGMYTDIFTEFPPSYDVFFYLFAGLLVKETISKKSTSKYFSIGAIINKCWGILYFFFTFISLATILKFQHVIMVIAEMHTLFQQFACRFPYSI